jgi:uncharacterized membrane protein (DUF106 family)
MASLIFVLLQRFLIDQEKVRELKKLANEYRKKLAAAQKKGDVKEVNRYTSLMLQLSSEQMGSMLKMMLAVMIVLGPVFFGLSVLYPDVVVSFDNGQGNMNYNDLSVPVVQVGDGFDVGGQIVHIGDEIKLNGYDFELNRNCGYIAFFCSDPTKEIKFSRIVAWLPFSLPFFGNNLGWLGWYLFLFIPLNQLFRKIFGVM